MKRKDKYEQVVDHVPFKVGDGETWYLACCDCGLVHTVKIATDGEGALKITMARHQRKTANRRRSKVGQALPFGRR